MTSTPTLRTPRLTLGAFTEEDAPELQRLAGAREIADTTLGNSPSLRVGSRHRMDRTAAKGSFPGTGHQLCHPIRSSGALIGSVGLRDIDPEHLQAELGFWIGREWWGNGYAREAAAAVIDFGFDSVGLNRICAHHMVRNPSAGKVLHAAGMLREGLLRQRVRKWGVYEDVVVYAIIREDRS